MRIVFFFFSFFLFLSLCLPAQPLDYTIAQSRQLVHYNLDKIQKQLLAADGKADDKLVAGMDEEVNLQLSFAATKKVDAIQKSIELDTSLSNNQKLQYLRGLGEYILSFISNAKAKKIKLVELPETIKAWENAYTANVINQSIEPIIASNSFAIGTLLINCYAFANNVGMPVAKPRLQLKYIEENPAKLLQVLSIFPEIPWADSLILTAAKANPENLYNYAQAASTPLGILIRSNKHPMVRQIVALASDNSGQLYFPFLDNLLKQKITTDSIKKVINDSVAYLRLLVKTQIEYAGMAAKGDTPMVWHKLTQMIHTKAYQPFVNTINGLHDSPELVRFKVIEPLSPQELYYLAVSCETEIYTSSYVNIYKRIWQRMPVPSADSLLRMVNNNQFKKFITMAANYNTLDDFLSKMSKEKANTLMTNFVNNLDKTNDLEDAVDVANSYASIKNDTIKKLMLGQITKNYERYKNAGNNRGEIIYKLEKIILESSDTTLHINLSDSLGILPVYDVANHFLRDSSGRIVLQMYFYGDETGRGSYQVLQNLYANKNWKLTKGINNEWVQYNSVGSKVPFVIFANRAGDEEKNEDALAQEHLNMWMYKNGYAPSITVHRGHSYYLKYTVEQMNAESKIVILGSCGAYHTMDDILKICPDAYLIASKQTGYGVINVPLFANMIELLKNGENINWPAYWKLLATKISKEKKEGFDDYIPPYKNLGAIFIKAYAKQSEKNKALPN